MFFRFVLVNASKVWMIASIEDYGHFYGSRNVYLIFFHFVLVNASKVWMIHNNEEYAHFYGSRNVYLISVFTTIRSLMRKIDHMMNLSHYRSSIGLVFVFHSYSLSKKGLKFGPLKIAKNMSMHLG